MTSEPDGSDLWVEADLRVDVDSVRAQVVGRGDELEVLTDRPADLWRAVARSSPEGHRRNLRAVHAVVDTLADNGVTVTVPAPGGAQVRVGAAAHSGLVGRALRAGHVQVVTPPGVRRVVRSVAVVCGVAFVVATLRRGNISR